MAPGEDSGDARAATDDVAREIGEISLVLRELGDGSEAARERLLGLVYDQLRRIAAGYLRRERAGHTMEPSDLVHEASSASSGPLRRH